MKRRLRDELVSVGNTIQHARRSTAATTVVERAWRLDGRLRNTVVLAYALADYRADAAVVLLRQRAPKFGWAPKPDEEITRIVEDCFLDCDVAELAALRDGDAPLDPVSLRDATSSVEQWRVAVWVATQNRTAGVAVSTAIVLDEFEVRRAALHPSARSAAWGSSGEAVARMRASRWRKRFGGQIGVLRARDELPHAEILGKVHRFFWKQHTFFFLKTKENVSYMFTYRGPDVPCVYTTHMNLTQRRRQLRGSGTTIARAWFHHASACCASTLTRQRFAFSKAVRGAISSWRKGNRAYNARHWPSSARTQLSSRSYATRRIYSSYCRRCLLLVSGRCRTRGCSRCAQSALPT